MNILLIFLFCGLANSALGKEIYLLKTKGACPDCAEKIAAVLQKNNYASQIISASELKKKLTPKDLLIVPGGDSEWDIKADLIKAQAFDRVKNFIKLGGSYVGFCAGAYLAEEWIVENEKGLDIFPGKITNYSPIKKSRPIRISWENEKKPRTMFFQDGPVFLPRKDAKVKVLATFTDDNRPAAVVFAFGKGKVGLISPHPEADQEWYEVDNVKDEDGPDHDLAMQFLKNFLE